LLKAVLQRAGGLGIGTAVGQGLILAATPFLARMYEPEEFGALALLITVSNIAFAAGCARFDLAVPGASADEVPSLVRLSVLVSALLALIAGIIVAVSAGNLLSGQGASLIASALLGGLCFLLAATYHLAGSVLLQGNAIRTLAYSRAAQGGLFVFLAAFETIGLSWALTLSYVPGIMLLARHLPAKRNGPTIFTVAVRFRRLALYGLPGALLDVVGYSLCIWVVLTVFGSAQSGELSQVQRVIGAPLMLASISLGQILLKQASDLRDDPAELIGLIRSLLAMMGFAAVLGIGTLALAGQPIFALLLGPAWTVSDTLVVCLGIAVFVRATVSPFSTVLVAYDRLDLAFWWQLSYFISALVLFRLVALSTSFKSFVAFYAAHEFIHYAIYLMIILTFLRKLRCAESSAR
jgi:O-antigen/teichoic acid export membrane protein